MASRTRVTATASPGALPQRKLGRNETVAAVAAGITIVAVLQFSTLIDWIKPSPPEVTDNSTPGAPVSSTIEAFAENEVSVPLPQQLDSYSLFFNIPASMQTMWNIENQGSQQADILTDELLRHAALAAKEQDEQALGDGFALLGLHALRLGDGDGALVYLEEALDTFEFLGNESAIAGVELLRGKVNVQKRELARTAALAYDDLQIAGWTIAQGRFHDSVEKLQKIIDTNLSMDRYGAASAAYDYLYRGYTEQGQLAEAQTAGIEIVRLQASSGRPLKATAMLEKLRHDGLDEDSVKSLQYEISQLQGEYENSVQQIGKARNYQQLYHHFINAGDPVRAWQFRIKASSSLRDVSKRAMYKRQAGVMALLYNSNDEMRDARRSLQRARSVFETLDSNQFADEFIETSDELQQRIY